MDDLAPSTRLGTNSLLEGPQVQSLIERSIAVVVFRPQVNQQAAPLADQLEQPASRGFVVFMGAQVLGELVDTGSKKRDLHFGRPRVIFMTVVVADQCGFLFLR